jgi:hypothetical protein
MHWNFEQILWAMLLAAHLVLLIVLLGRDRASRWPWFTASISLSAVRVLADHLLHGKLTAVAFYWQSYSLAVVGSILQALVLVELTRRVFSSGRGGVILKAKGWLGGVMLSVAVAVAVVWVWGPWPSWQALNAQPALLPLRLVWLSALKLDLLVAVLSVVVMLLVNLFGGQFDFGWKTHARQIALGLSTIAISQYTVEGISQAIIRQSAHLTSRDQVDRVVHLLTNLDQGRTAIWLLALVWWMVWLWRDEPSTGNPVLLPEPTLAVDSESETSPQAEAEEFDLPEGSTVHETEMERFPLSNQENEPL